ncbi:hypothetical protein LENED_004148 [Lentinula edodes]|uniref:Uncharacterized protein n=1 Tax=Lentinula edodes TaxID=5353 RepID=A0A1Q3E5H2_LENED|nr:hypothetical protein LENED_004148 [Lentinula edodes]
MRCGCLYPSTGAGSFVDLRLESQYLQTLLVANPHTRISWYFFCWSRIVLFTSIRVCPALCTIVFQLDQCYLSPEFSYPHHPCHRPSIILFASSSSSHLLSSSTPSLRLPKPPQYL